MKKILAALCILAALGGFVLAEEDGGLGVSVGAAYWKDADSEGDAGFAPFAEFEKSIDALDMYFKAEYDMKFDDDDSKALYLQETFTYNVGEAGPGELSVYLDNYNLFGTSIESPVYFYIPDDDIFSKDDKITGFFEVGLTYGFSSGLSLTAGFDMLYLPGKIDDGSGGKVNVNYKELFGIIGYEKEIGPGTFGAECKALYTLDYGPDDAPGATKDKSVEGVYEYDLTLSYGTDKFLLAVETDFVKDDDGTFFDNLSITPSVEVYAGDITVFGELKLEREKHYVNSAGEEKAKLWTGFMLGAKYSF
jgi:hypothetical protein